MAAVMGTGTFSLLTAWFQFSAGLLARQDYPHFTDEED